jgi:hypothetical protein
VRRRRELTCGGLCAILSAPDVVEASFTAAWRSRAARAIVPGRLAWATVASAAALPFMYVPRGLDGVQQPSEVINDCLYCG